MLCLTSSFSVLTLGSNTCHQLTLKPRQNEDPVFDSVEPVVVNMPNDLLVPVQVCCGAASSHVLTSDGSVVGWGLNDCGQIGSGYVGNGLTEGLRKNKRLQHVPTLSPYFGPNRSGEVGKKIHPISAMIKKLLYNAKKDGNADVNTSNNNPEHVDGRPYGVLLVAGDRHCGLLTDHGTVYTWGCEERGRLGLGDVRSGTGNYVLEPKAVDVNGGKNQECVLFGWSGWMFGGCLLFGLSILDF